MDLPNQVYFKKYIDREPVTKVWRDALFIGPPIGWFNLAGRSTITGHSLSKTPIDMLEAYKKNKTLRDLEALLPQDAEAVKHTLKNSLKKEPSDSLAMLILARCHVLCEEQNEAKHTLDTLISREPDHVPAQVELANILFNEDDPQAAIKLLVNATSLRPDVDANWLLLSEYLQSDGQLEASKNALKQYDMIKAFNENLKLAEESFARGDFAKADKICRHLLGLVPTEVRTLRLLARIAKRFHEF